LPKGTRARIEARAKTLGVPFHDAVRAIVEQWLEAAEDPSRGVVEPLIGSVAGNRAALDDDMDEIFGVGAGAKK
jgi:hypothetical protein